MFEVLSSCEDYDRDRKSKKLINDHDRERVRISLLKAIVMFSEAFRFRSFYLFMLERLRDDSASCVVAPDSWTLIHNWDHRSAEVLKLWKNDLPPMHTEASVFFEKIKVRRPGCTDSISLNELGNIIGENGEFMLLNVGDVLIVPAAEYQRRVGILIKHTCPPIGKYGSDPSQLAVLDQDTNSPLVLSCRNY
jgi:hypothetical protein